MRIKHIEGEVEKSASSSISIIKTNSIKIMVATPTYDGRVSSKYSLNLTQTVLDLYKHGINCDLRHAIHMPHDMARNILVKNFMESDCTHLLFIDEDQGWDSSKIIDMCNANKGFVAAGIRYKRDDEEYPLVLEVMHDQSLKVENGLIKTSRIGVALALIKKEVFEKILQKIQLPKIKDYGFNFFDYHVRNFGPHGYYQSEDNDFCDKCRKSEIDLWIFPDINTTHIGSKHYEANFHEFCRKFPSGDLNEDKK